MPSHNKSYFEVVSLEKTLYFETFPLGTIAVSKIAAIVAFAGVILELWNPAYWLIPIYAVLYVLGFIYNIKLRAITCKYYGKTIHSKISKIFDRFPPKLEAEKITSESKALVAISVFSYILVLLPGVFFILIMVIIQNPSTTGQAILFLTIYVIALIVPSFILKKKILSGVCEI